MRQVRLVWRLFGAGRLDPRIKSRVDAADVDNSGTTTVVITNFSGEMLGLYRPVGD